MKALAGIIFIVILNILFFLVGQTLVGVGLTNNVYTYDGSVMSKFNNGDQTNYSMRAYNETDLPTETKTVDPSTGNIFTDVWSTISNWVKGGLTAIVNLIPGHEFIIAMFAGLHIFLVAINIPSAVVFAIDFLWYAFTLFMIVLFIRGD
jgi:hypothetical protein